MLTIKEFLAGTPKVPRPLVADAYTIGSVHISPQEKERSVFHVVPRRGVDHIHRFAMDDRLIFTGLTRVLRDFFAPQVTWDEIDEADEFLNTFHAGGTRYRWDVDMWMRIVRENHGIIPLRIDAFPEGTTAFPYEPVIQVTTGAGYGGLGVWFESKLLQVWASMERATTLKWWFESLKTWCKRVHPSWKDEQVDFACSIMMHDFGDRAGSCAQESEVLGLAHVLVAPGTDTVAGAYQYWKNSNKSSWPCSIHALAHHTVMGFKHELDAHIELYQIGRQTGITAHVSDTYNFHAMAEKLVSDMAKFCGEDKNIIVIRPDSGNPVDCIKYILKMCEKYNLFAVNDGLKVATKVRWIQGDSMDWDTMATIMAECLKIGWSPFGSGAFGIGGHLRNSIARDHTGLSMKLAEVGFEGREVVKRSDTPAKTSIPGMVEVYDNNTADRPTVYRVNHVPDGVRGGPTLLQPYYDGRDCNNLENAFFPAALVSPNEIRGRIKDYFMRRKRPTNVLSNDIVKARDKILHETVSHVTSTV